MDFKILHAYKDNSERGLAVLQFGGLVGIALGAIIDSSGASIAGGAALGSGILGEGVEYAKAYMEATLDYKANGRFTKVNDK